MSVLFLSSATFGHLSDSGSSDLHQIKETIPQCYKKKYEQWKAEYLSTYVGQQEWQKFDHDRNFDLTITVTKEKGRGAEVINLQWSAEGELIAATIVLGSALDSGYPGAFNYPVLCSLDPGSLSKGVPSDVLAASKLAHEFGHINNIARVGAATYNQQNDFIRQYNRIFFHNGMNAKDPRLLELLSRMGGSPVDIMRDREHEAEASSALYLKERLRTLNLNRPLSRSVGAAIELYEKIYQRSEYSYFNSPE